jgi:hypothetical protein
MKPITLDYLEETAAKALITEPLRERVAFGPGAVDELYELTTGHPYPLISRIKCSVNGQLRLNPICP